MKIAIAGTGYVGLSNACLLAQNHEVVALDILADKVATINQKRSPIADPKSKRFWHTNRSSLNLRWIKTRRIEAPILS